MPPMLTHPPQALFHDSLDLNGDSTRLGSTSYGTEGLDTSSSDIVEFDNFLDISGPWGVFIENN